MMKKTVRFYQIFYGILLLLGLCWILPEVYEMALPKRQNKSFTLFSEVTGEFASFEWNKDLEKIVYYDHTGRTYTQSEFDSILPSFYRRQLSSEGRLPDTLKGRKITKAYLDKYSFIFRSHPSMVNIHHTPLYMLLESMPKRVDLESPSEVFRFTVEGIEIIDMKSGRVEQKKTQEYRKVFQDNGFVYPARLVAGNPTTRKDYDQGYLLCDARGQIFHFKQCRGQAFLRPIPLPEHTKPSHLYVTEFDSQEYLGFWIDDSGGFYVIIYPGYQCIRADLPPVNASRDVLTIYGNPFYWTVEIIHKGRTQSIALDAQDLSRVKAMESALPTFRGVDQYLFPFKLSFTSSFDGYFYPRFTQFSAIATAIWSGIVVLIAVYLRRATCRLRVER